MYEVCYTNCQGERRVKRKVATWDQAKEIAKELAIATGYRTIIRRDREELWDVMMFKFETLELLLVEAGVPYADAKKCWERFDHRKYKAAILLLPDGAPRLC